MKQQPPCDDKSSLMDYLYGECDADERRVVEKHLAGCAACAAELEELRGVRGALREWAQPEPALGFRLVREEVTTEDRGPKRAGDRLPALRPPMTRRRWWAPSHGVRVPAWAQLAAAVLVLAVGAAIANLDVRIGTDGVTIRTGWRRVPATQTQAVRAPAAPAAAAPWRSDLAALEGRLRQEISAIPVAAPGAPLAADRVTSSDRAALMRQVQVLVEDMGQRQQRAYDRQLAERFLRFAHDVNAQRAADLRLIQQGVGQMDARTTSEVVQLRQAFLRVASVQQMK